MGAAVLWQVVSPLDHENRAWRRSFSRKLLVNNGLRDGSQRPPTRVEGIPSAFFRAEAAEAWTATKPIHDVRSVRRHLACTTPRIEVLPTRNPKVIFKALATGAVLYSTEEEVYFGLNPVGVRVWELLPPVQQQLDDVCRIIAADYPDVPADVIRADITELLEELTKLGLVKPSSAPAERAS